MIAVLLLSLAVGCDPASSHQAAVISVHRPTCTRFASPAGTDNAALLARNRHAGRPGSRRNPFATPQRLLQSLGPGQTGCLLAGTYYGEVRFNRGGSAGKPITLQSYPGQRATIAGGYVYMPPGSNYVTLQDLNINGQATSQISVQILSNHVSLIADDITNEQQHNSCITLGYTQISPAVNTLVEGNLIHDCGSPSDGNQDHAIYFDDSYGALVRDNVFWGTAGYAIHLYEHADYNRIVHNVIVDNDHGVIFAGSASFTSSGNLVADNVIADSSIGDDVMQSWAGAVGQDNRLQSNCIYNSRRSGDHAAGARFHGRRQRIRQPAFHRRGGAQLRPAGRQPVPPRGRLRQRGRTVAALGGRLVSLVREGPAQRPHEREHSTAGSALTRPAQLL